MMSASRRHAAALAFVLGGGLLACQIIAGIDEVEKVPRPVDAGEDADTGAPFVPDPCDHVRPPRDPANEDPGDELPDFVLALRTLSLVPSGDAGLPGFDLDGVCTCDERPGSIEAGASSCVRPGKACDADGGLDNNGARLIEQLAFVPDVNESINITSRINAGRQTLLVVISKYNGKANDKEVKLGLVPSDGIRQSDPSLRCKGSVKDPIGDHYSSAWCGQDPWSIVPGTVVPANGTPLGFTPTAVGTGYVADYKLVVRLETGTTGLPFGPSRLELGSPETVMALVPLDENLQPRDKSRAPTIAEKRLWRIESGVLAGRLPARDLLAAAGTIPTPGSGGSEHLCRSGLFTELKEIVCEDLDIARTRSFDFVANRACDALSMAVSFTADPAVWIPGDYYQEPAAPNECAPGPEDRPVDAGVDVVYRCDLGQQ